MSKEKVVRFNKLTLAKHGSPLLKGKPLKGKKKEDFGAAVEEAKKESGTFNLPLKVYVGIEVD